MRPKSLVLLSLALGCGLVAALGINQMMAKQRPSSAPAGETVEIYVAAKDVNINDVMAEQAVKLEQWPKDKVPLGALSKWEEVEGRRAKSKLYAGEPLLDAKLLAKGQAAQEVSEHIPSGYRVVSIRVDAVSAASNLVKPGDRVDLLVHLLPTTQNGEAAQPVTKTFLEDVRVFAVNDVIDRDPANGNAKITAQTVSLLVKPENVELITFATEMGKIRLSMRGPADDVKTDTAGADLRKLLGLGGDHGPESNRKDEEPNKQPEPQIASTPETVNPLMALLGKLKPKDPSETEEKAPEPAKPFRMLMLLGPEVQEMEMDPSQRRMRGVAPNDPQPPTPSTEEPEAAEPEQSLTKE